ncbi:uncharacterized protein LOC131575460 isoform X2 [Poecile atricapillus]|uniref:uncharacterized protein LOC131575460 isoform X2 n=1 Tax=Poecile atricapillus TaxID=48891 RepID=UPI00273A2FCE|nr:uncharacterized protein LOC131575460 isoform X2 [Poecile atricapillus]
MGWIRTGSRSLAALGGLRHPQAQLRPRRLSQDPRGAGELRPGMAGKVTGVFPRTRRARVCLPAPFPLLRLPSRHMARRPRPGSGSGRQTATAGLLLPARQEGTRRAGWLLRAPACAPGVSPRSRALPERLSPRLAGGLGLKPGFLGPVGPRLSLLRLSAAKVLAQREPWQLENSPNPTAALGFGEGRRQRGAAPPPRQAGDPRGRAGGFSQLLQRCWRDLLARGGETRYPALRLGGREGWPHAERTPPDTLPESRDRAQSIRGSFAQLRPTPPQPLRILRAVEYSE